MWRGELPPGFRAGRETGGEGHVDGKDRTRNSKERRVSFRPSESEYVTLKALAQYHRRTVAGLVSAALPRVIEKYRVLRALDRRAGEMAAGRRRR